jgi:SAM-dependent methyltransferase
MAASIPWNILRAHSSGAPLRVLDPMMGSGTTAVVARSLGHKAIGVDMDPLAVLISRTWCSDFDRASIFTKGMEVLTKAASSSVTQGDAYPPGASEDTKRFVRYWFDPHSRQQLTALARHIARVPDEVTRTFLWCAFSRLIVVKQAGVSRAMDVAHSRPHRVYSEAPLKPFDGFSAALSRVLAAAPFHDARFSGPAARLLDGDARALPVSSATIDLVVTSPPYLNAIDYLRGHRLSLVWMAHGLKALRNVRSDSIGAERIDATFDDLEVANAIEAAVEDPEELSERAYGMLSGYLRGMKQVIKEISRVLKPEGRAVLVIGNSTLKGVFIKNSTALAYLAREHGLRKVRAHNRPLPPNRRYLPPPTERSAGGQLQKRMGCEVILTLQRY